MHGRPILVVAVALLAAPALAGLATPISSTSQARANLSIEEAWRVSGDDFQDGPIGAVNGIGVTPNGQVWISDPLRSRVVALKPTGEADRVIAPTGPGPGEVQSPSLITLGDDIMAVYQVSTRTIEVFSALSGEYLRTVRLQGSVSWPKGFVALADGGFLLSGGLLGSRRSIHHFDRDGTRVNSWEETPSDAHDLQALLMVIGGGLALLQDQTVVYSRAVPHGLFRYRSADGTFITQAEVIAADPELLDAVGDDAIRRYIGEDGRQRQGRRRFPRSAGVFQMSSGDILNVVVFPEEERTLLRLRTSGTGGLVAEASLQPAIVPYALSSTDELLAAFVDSNSEEWVVVKYGVAIQ